jgi:hypothetical protein
MALGAMLAVLVLASRGLAQTAGTIENLREKAAITEQDRQQIRAWVTAAANAVVTNADPDRRGMIAARDAILNEGRKEGRSAAYYQAFGDEAIAALKDAEKKAVSQDARVNLMMAVAELRRMEGIDILRTALEKDPYAAVRYWAAKGLAMAADVVLERNAPRIEAEIADSIAKVIDNETAGVTLYFLFEALGRFDHDKSHDALADAAAKYVMRVNAADPIASQTIDGIIKSLEKAYGLEARPDAKARVLSAYATLCAWIMPAKDEPDPLFIAINASLEKITGEKVGFVAADGAVLQKLALLEWVEKFVKEKRIPRRPSLPPAIERAAKDAAGSATAP